MLVGFAVLLTLWIRPGSWLPVATGKFPGRPRLGSRLMMATVSSDQSGRHSRGCVDLRPGLNIVGPGSCSGNQKSGLAREAKRGKSRSIGLVTAGFSCPELTLISGDAHVIICFQLARRAEIEIMVCDQPRAEVMRSRATAASSGQRFQTPRPTASRDALDAQTGMIAAKAADENFPVAMRALPGRYRRHLMAVYVFARTPAPADRA